jgi:ADP-heptose:LPS heptosyltransferase
MLDSFRRWLGMQTARYRFRAVRDPILAFRSAFSAARSALIVLPFDGEPAPQLLDLAEALKTRFPQDRITIIAAEHQYDIGRLLPRSQVVRVPGRDLTSLFLPRADMTAAVTARQYDLAIDLNLDFVMPSGYICRVSGARIRMGYARAGAEHFFNFIIKRKPGMGRERAYHRLAEFLREF